VTFLSLFAGIGGFDLGLERAGMTCVGQCEIDPFCLAVLARHWPHVWRHDDIRTLTGELVRRNCGGVDLVCGGFPCQDISAEGKGDGIDGSRSGLWREMLRVVREVRTHWVLAENVGALRNRGYDRVHDDLVTAGYACRQIVVGAEAVGSPHKRERVWIVGYAGRD
jgi:DNA (cytosine-5)-methyltransferase 1